MDWSKIQNGWNDYKGDAMQQWSKLSEEQLASTEGRREYLSSRLQEVYMVSPDEAERQIAAWQGKQIAKPSPAAKS